MADLAEVLRQLQTTNRNVGGGGLMGLTEPQTLPAAGPIDLPQRPDQVPTDVHGLPVLPPLAGPQPGNPMLQFLSSYAQPNPGTQPPTGPAPTGPAMTAGYLPTWPQTLSDASHRLMPQVAEQGLAMGQGAANIAMQGGVGGAIANRYTQGGWRAGLEKAGQDFDAVVGLIRDEPARLKAAYLSGEGNLKNKIAKDPLGTLMDAGWVVDPAIGGVRMASGRMADQLLARHLAGVPIQPPAVQGMLAQHPGQVVPGMGAPDVAGMQGRVDRARELSGIMQAQEGQIADYNPQGMTVPEIGNPYRFDPLQEPTAQDTIGRVMQQQDLQSPWGGTDTFFDPLKEPTAPDTIGRVMQAQDMRGQQVGLSPDKARSIGLNEMPPLQHPIDQVMAAQSRMAHNAGKPANEVKSLGQVHMPPLEEPLAFDTMGRHLQEQDKALNLWGGKSKIAHLNRFDRLREPNAFDTIGNIMQRQDELGGSLAKSLPEYMQGRPPEPGPRVLEEKFGQLQMRGTPTLDTPTVDMRNTRLQEEIGLLKERRAYATNKHDREWYDNRIKEMQDAQVTPDATADPWSGGLWGFHRTSNPSETAIPFRRHRYTDPHPREMGEGAPGKTPGTYRQTQDQGKHWEWRRAPSPAAPGSRTIADQMGSDFAQPVRWTGTLGGGDSPMWRLTPDRAAMRQAGPARVAPPVPPRAGRAVTEPGGQLRMPGVQEAFPPYVPVGTRDIAVHQVNEAMDKIAQWERRFGNRPMARKLEDAVIAERDAREAAKRNPPLFERSPAQGLMDMNPALRPHPAQDVFGQRPNPSEFARPPGEGTYVKAEAGTAAAEDVNAALGKIAKFVLKGGDKDVAAKMADAARKAGEGGGKIVWKPKQPEGLLDQQPPTTPTKDPNQYPMFGLPKNLSPFDPAGRATFKTVAPELPWNDYLDPRKYPNNAIELNQQPGAEYNVNKTFKVGLDGDMTDPYFWKQVTRFGNAKFEVAAMEVGDILGVDTLPAVMINDTTFVTPWQNGPTLRANPNLAKKIILGMDEGTRTRKTLFEFLVADTDKHPGNWILDEDGGRIIGIDYGGALGGNHRAMLHPVRGNVNAYYRMVNDYVPRDTPLDKTVISDLMAKEAEVIEHFKKSTAGNMEISGLRDRFSRMKALEMKPAPTYGDLKAIVDGN